MLTWYRHSRYEQFSPLVDATKRAHPATDVKAAPSQSDQSQIGTWKSLKGNTTEDNSKLAIPKSFTALRIPFSKQKILGLSTGRETNTTEENAKLAFSEYLTSWELNAIKDSTGPYVLEFFTDFTNLPLFSSLIGQEIKTTEDDAKLAVTRLIADLPRLFSEEENFGLLTGQETNTTEDDTKLAVTKSHTALTNRVSKQGISIPWASRETNTTEDDAKALVLESVTAPIHLPAKQQEFALTGRGSDTHLSQRNTRTTVFSQPSAPANPLLIYPASVPKTFQTSQTQSHHSFEQSKGGLQVSENDTLYRQTAVPNKPGTAHVKSESSIESVIKTKQDNEQASTALEKDATKELRAESDSPMASGKFNEREFFKRSSTYFILEADKRSSQDLYHDFEPQLEERDKVKGFEVKQLHWRDEDEIKGIEVKQLQERNEVKSSAEKQTSSKRHEDNDKEIARQNLDNEIYQKSIVKWTCVGSPVNLLCMPG